MSANISLSRTKSVRVPVSNTPKALTSSQQQSLGATGPSNITLFLTNLRLLDFDLRDDWPGITAVTFSTKDAQQNQKKRVQCVEWALYQLFAIWDPEETRDKLQPFFPPLEHLQSLNLRAALVRCLDQAKKSGALGRDVLLRKTMLDECKGERLEEVIAVFSTAVLKKVVRESGKGNQRAIAVQLAMENFSYTGERTALNALIAVHKSSLGLTLAMKNEAKARYDDFADLLNLKERQSIRRGEQLKVSIEEGFISTLAEDEAQELRDRVDKNWSGSSEWLETILYGEHASQSDGLLSGSFNDVWKHVEDGSIGDVEYAESSELLEQLDARVRQQTNRLAKWHSFEKSLSRKADNVLKKENSQDFKKQSVGIDLGFGMHENLQLNYGLSKQTGNKPRAPLAEYAQLIANLHTEISNVGKRENLKMQPQGEEHFDRGSIPTTSSTVNSIEDTLSYDQGHISASNTDTDEPSPGFENFATKSISQTPPSEHVADREESISPLRSSNPVAEVETEPLNDITPSASRSISTHSAMPPPSPPSRTSSPLASEILASVLQTSPSPTKPRHVLSLAERTRLSMSRTSIMKPDFHLEDMDDDLPDIASSSHTLRAAKGLRISTNDFNVPTKSNTQHEDLIARTRQSMSNFSAVQKNAQLDRRRSIKATGREKRKSYLPKPLETPEEDEDLALDGVDKKKLIEGEVEVDYDVVFKSRPRIKTSPERSPERSPVKTWSDMGGMAGSSSPLTE